MTLRQEEPLNAEPRLSSLADSWITNVQDFYIRIHGETKRVEAETYSLKISGLVERPLCLSLEDLRSDFRSTNVAATLECGGNRRQEHMKTKLVAGVPWTAGAIGNALWGGVPLVRLLERAGLKPEARFVHFEGLDRILVRKNRIPFGQSIPLEKALEPETLLALDMNGSSLTVEHGFPVRMVVPGYIGARSVKWLGSIVVSDVPSTNHFIQNEYKLFPPDVGPDEARPETLPPILEYTLNSAICWPPEGARVPAGRLQVRGYAIAPPRSSAPISAVDVSCDEGRSWTRATLESADAPFTWRLWRAEVDVTSASTSLLVCATDARGRRQPRRPDWNLKGLLYDGWHRVAIQVL